ncbi:vacuolar sorting receptor [Striga asiatica]|uniref:Vacuolar sorting receptor n=1 Tax=Striga asiatica TaxID=4170 RepID=A0A5A7Q719_STRAF|nr:vacuolar sorting receptor [Striga asiatica]
MHPLPSSPPTPPASSPAILSLSELVDFLSQPDLKRPLSDFLVGRIPATQLEEGEIPVSAPSAVMAAVGAISAAGKDLPPPAQQPGSSSKNTVPSSATLDSSSDAPIANSAIVASDGALPAPLLFSSLPPMMCSAFPPTVQPSFPFTEMELSCCCRHRSETLLLPLAARHCCCPLKVRRSLVATRAEVPPLESKLRRSRCHRLCRSKVADQPHAGVQREE